MIKSYCWYYRKERTLLFKIMLLQKFKAFSEDLELDKSLWEAISRELKQLKLYKENGNHRYGLDSYLT